MRYYSEIGKPYRRAIVLCRVHPGTGGGIDAVARKFGLAVHDLIWITNYDNWRQHIEGVSRNTLVLDPCNLTHEWCQRDEQEFAIGIRSAFNNVVMAPQCEAALAKWLSIHNPPAYARMVASGVVPEPPARDCPSLEQEPQETLKPQRDSGAGGISLGLPHAAAEDRASDTAGGFQP